MKVILLSVLGTLALGSLSGISISHKDNTKLTEDRLNANYDLDNDPYCKYSSVVYEVDPEKQTYFTGHGNPDWYRIEDEVKITDVSQIDLNTVEYLNYTNNTATTFFNVEIEFSKYISGFSISIAAYTPLTEGQIVINYRFHKDPYPESYYDDIDDSINELLPVYKYNDDSGDNDKYRFSKRVHERGSIEGTINTYNWWIAFWNGSEIDQDWFAFSIQYKLKYTFNFKAPNDKYVLSFYSYKNLDKTPNFKLYGLNLITTKSKTITLYPGTYFMCVTVENKDYVRDEKYTIDYSGQKPANNKLLLKPEVMKTAKMAVWNNDILSDLIPNKFERSEYNLYSGSRKDFFGIASDYVDPMLFSGPVLDSLLVIWDKDICRCIETILSKKDKMNTMEQLLKQNDHTYELVAEGIDEGINSTINILVKKGNDVVLKVLGISYDIVDNFNIALKLYEIAAKIICDIFFKPDYSPEEIAKYFGGFVSDLYNAASYTAKPGNEDWAMFIPIYGKIITRISYTGPDPTPQNPRPIWTQVTHFNWKRSLFEVGKYHSFNPDNLEYRKHSISQYQTILDYKHSDWKKTSHGTIKLLSDTNEIINYLSSSIQSL